MAYTKEQLETYIAQTEQRVKNSIWMTYELKKAIDLAKKELAKLEKNNE